MSSTRPAVGGGRWIEVSPVRLARWIDGFVDRHGPFDTSAAGPEFLRLTAADGALVDLYPPPGVRWDGDVSDVATLLADVQVGGPLGLLLARRGAVAVGVADGDRLTATKVETRYVQGRTAAGGWSQQRFARRRANQAREAATAAADIAARLLLPAKDRLAAVVCGGDKLMVEAILADRRLAPLLPLRVARLLDVPEPRHAALAAALISARAVRLLLHPGVGEGPIR